MIGKREALVQDQPSLRRLDLVELSGLGDEFVHRSGVDGVDDQDDVLLAGHLPDKIDLLPVDHPLADRSGVDVHLY